MASRSPQPAAIRPRSRPRRGSGKTHSNGLAPGRAIGKYRLSRKLGEGGSGEVWKAHDTVEGIWVALKIPLPRVDGTEAHDALRKEVRLVASLRHEHILPIKNADIIDGRLVLATELSVGTLDDRRRPMRAGLVMSIMEQVLGALAYAHRQRVVHCDVSPTNIFLFPDGRAALGDFGISRYQKGRVVTMEEFGTPGYVAPEQAYGKPLFASDCFAAGLIIYEFITGHLPKWPFEWPMRGLDRLQTRTNWQFTRVIRKALEVRPKNRYRDAAEMLQAIQAAIPDLLARSAVAPRRSADWRKVRREAFRARYGKALSPDFDCVRCREPISEAMACCPWCGETGNRFDHLTEFPGYCPDCSRGVLPEWRYCPWCYGPGFAEHAERLRPHRRYKARCRHCSGKLMPFMRYCPWCHRKCTRPWVVHPLPDRCQNCRWSVVTSFWTYCPWCCAVLVP